MRSVGVALGPASYEVKVGAGLLGDATAYPDGLADARVVLVADSAVARRWVPVVGQALGERLTATVTVPAGEASKSWDRLAWLCGEFSAAGLNRHGWVLALGGGVVGDLAGFAAATHMRGVRHVLLPTTLLAQVDASVGGKTGINTPAGKNLAGAFHQPAAVLADVATLASLPRRDFMCGMAECVKHGLLEPTVLDFIEGHVDGLRQAGEADPDLLAELVARNVACKAAVVGDDEREAGRRAHLNLGHTFAHAFEAAFGYGAMPHGEAVAIGLVAACRLGERLGKTQPGLADRIRGLLVRLGLPVTLPAHDRTAVLQAMGADKKADAQGGLRFIIVAQPGQPEVVSDVPHGLVGGILDSLTVAG